MHVPRSGIAIFNFLRKLHTVIHSGHTNLLPYHILAYIRYLLGFVYFVCFGNSHPNKCDVISHYGFNLNFLLICIVELLFISLLTMYAFGEMSIQFLCQFLKLSCLFAIEL